jgi:hypothetical protein
MTGLIVRPTEVKYEHLKISSKKKQKSHLFARWLKVDGKLICPATSVEN